MNLTKSLIERITIKTTYDKKAEAKEYCWQHGYFIVDAQIQSWLGGGRYEGKPFEYTIIAERRAKAQKK